MDDSSCVLAALVSGIGLLLLALTIALAVFI